MAVAKRAAASARSAPSAVDVDDGEKSDDEPNETSTADKFKSRRNSGASNFNAFMEAAAERAERRVEVTCITVMHAR